MSDRMKLLEDAYQNIDAYTKAGGSTNWRPGLIDLYVYTNLINKYESDIEDGNWIWSKTPDEVMEEIIASARIFDLEYGWEVFDEEVRDYLIDHEYVTYTENNN